MILIYLDAAAAASDVTDVTAPAAAGGGDDVLAMNASIHADAAADAAAAAAAAAAGDDVDEIPSLGHRCVTYPNPAAAHTVRPFCQTFLSDSAGSSGSN